MNNLEDKIVQIAILIHAHARKQKEYEAADKVKHIIDESGIRIECFPKCTRYYKGMKLIYEG